MKSLACILCISTFALGFPKILGGQCVYDCYEVLEMCGVQSGTPYCYQFEEQTGRLLWSPGGGALGGTPASMDCLDGDTQQQVTTFTGCPGDCDADELPQTCMPVTPVGTIGFGCYYCYNP